MKPAELVKIFPALKGKKIRIWLGSSVQECTLKAIVDERALSSTGSVSVTDTEDLKIWAGQITKIEFI